eukprot:c24338_g1_i1 orf=222-1397(+)
MDGDDLGWTVVVRRKACNLQSSPACFHPSLQKGGSFAGKRKKKFGGAWGLSNLGTLQEAVEEEERILWRMNRSIETIQQSEFYDRFLQQLRSPRVLENLRRVGAVSSVSRDSWESSTRSPCDTGVGMQKGMSQIVRTLTTGLLDCPGDAEDDLRREGGERETVGFATREIAIGNHYESNTEGKLWNGYHIGGEAIGAEVEDGVDKATREEVGTGESEWRLDIVAYGVGSIADSEVSRCQLSLILLLKRNFQWVRKIEVFDPILSQIERNVIHRLDCSLITANEEGSRSIDRPTLFYMPHCEAWLYDNVLRANWSRQSLNQLIVLGNSFSRYQEIWSFEGNKRESPPTFVLKLQKYSLEIPFEATSSLRLNVFNNMSWHFFMVSSAADFDTF